MSLRYLLPAIFILSTCSVIANTRPAAPVVNEPAVDGQVVSGADVHIETSPFSDADAGADGEFRGTDYEIWTAAPSQRVWAALGVTGLESVHIHLGDGVFENSHAGRSDLQFDTDYLLRIRHRDNSNDPATQYSFWAERSFTTGSASAIFPLLVLDVLESPTPLWRDSSNNPLILDAGTTPPRMSFRPEDDGGDFLVISGLDGISNDVTHFAAADHHHALKIVIESGSQNVNLPPSTVVFSYTPTVSFTVYLPSLSLPAGQAKVFWVSLNGSTYHGSLAESSPSFSTLARGSAVPWVVQPGYTVEVVATGFQMPVNIAFIPNPGPNPTDPLYYVTELYGTIKVVRRNGVVSDYVSGLLNYTPNGAFPGAGEQGIGGIAVDPANGDVYLALLRFNPGTGNNNPRIVKFTSLDGGLTAATQTLLLDMAPEVQGQSHFCSNLSIGPDGRLYSHMGDGFDASSALNLDQFRGKILRLNLDGSAPADNPFYNLANGINARDYVWAYGVRNAFGGAWRNLDAAHYAVENGPNRDRLAKITAGTSYGWTGNDADMSINAIYNWEPATAPVNICFVQADVFSGSKFPAAKMDRAYVTLSGPTYAGGPQEFGKRIEEFEISPTGTLLGGPVRLLEYNGSGRATACGLAAGPDGLYFTDLYRDLDATSPIDAGANVLRVRFIGIALFTANATSGDLPLTVQFTDQSEVPEASSWVWDFGDGSTSTAQNPQHLYTAAGVYSVSLTVTGASESVLKLRANYIAAGVEPSGVSFRFYRFNPITLRSSSADSIQLSEFDFFFGGNSVVPGNTPTVTNPGGSNPSAQTPDNLVDGSTATKWLDYTKRSVVFDFGTTALIESYSFSTANDIPERDPVSWTLEGSDDGFDWTLLDTQEDFLTPVARGVSTGAITLIIVPPPGIVAFEAGSTIVEHGQQVTLSWQVEGADTVSLTPGVGNVLPNSSTLVSPASTTTYRLTASNSAATVVSQIVIEVRLRTSHDYRYFRFTPVELRNDALADSVQLAEIDFFSSGIARTGGTATNPGGNNPVSDQPSNALDDNTATKWRDFNHGPLVVDFGSVVSVDGYGFTTAGDSPERDPVSWTLEGSADGTSWTLLDTVSGYPTPGARSTATGDLPLERQPQPGLAPILFVVANAANPNIAELNVANELENLGYIVEFATDSLTDSGDASGKALIVVSSTVDSNQVNTKFRNTAVPVLVWAHALFADFGMTEDGTLDHDIEVNQSAIAIINPSHPLAASHSGTLGVFNPATGMTWGKPAAGATIIASLSGDSTKSAIFAYDTGASMFGLTAPARRVGWFFASDGGEKAFMHAWHLFQQAVKWSVNTPPTVSLDSPTGGAVYTFGGSLQITANSGDDNLAAIEFFADGLSLGTVTQAPFQLTWNNPPTGEHSLTATAMDEVGETATTVATVVTVLTPFEAYQVAHFSPAELVDPNLSGPDADFDYDGYNNLAEHFFGMMPTVADRPLLLTAQIATDGSVQFGEISFRYSTAATDVAVIVEASLTLDAWESGGDRLQLVDSIDHGDGTRTETYRSLFPDEAQEFFRLRLIGP